MTITKTKTNPALTRRISEVLTERTRRVRRMWTSEERAWRAMLAARKIHQLEALFGR